MADYEHLIVKQGAVSEVILNRPEVRNATSDVTLKELTRAFRELSKRSNLRAVVVKGEGKDFCAGADINWMRTAGRLPPQQARADAMLLVDMGVAIEECPVPVVAKVHGAVFGGGLGLTAACDIVVAETDARMCFSEARLGITPAVISCFVIPKIGAAAARRYYLTAEVFGMATALKMGLVHEVCQHGDLDKKVDDIVAGIRKNGPNAVREAKALLRKFPQLDFNSRVSLVLDTLARLRASPEGQEGLSAFLEKRAPSWAQP